MKLGVAAIARPTFDVEFARETAERAFTVVDSLADITSVGPRRLLLDHDDLAAATADLAAGDLDGLLVLQASFADSTLVAALAAATEAPVTLWAFPEDRTGGRLRLNSLCGINLAAFALRADGREVRHLYADPWSLDAGNALHDVLAASAPGETPPPAGHVAPGPEAAAVAAEVAERLESARIGVVGDRPDGFEPCGFNGAALHAATGVHAETLPLPVLFERAAEMASSDVAAVRSTFAVQLQGIDDVDGEALERSVRLHLGLLGTARERGWDALATRCWPECFTEFGGAACAPQSLLNDMHGLPAMCEADAYGAVTGLVLKWLTGTAPFVADLVHLDPGDNTAVFWHCGLAPLSMADETVAPEAGIHSNRRLPLLYEFPMRPGRVTIARLSQSRGRHRLVIGGAEMLRAPQAFSGTSGVARMDRPVADVLATIMSEGLEHHYGIAYGDVRGELVALAARLEMPVVDL